MLARRQIVMGAAAAVGTAMIRPLAAALFEWRKTFAL
jgi:H+/Cl- antiporter ClcA